MNEAIVVDTFVRRRAKSETMHEKRTRMIFTVDPPLLSTIYSCALQGILLKSYVVSNICMKNIEIYQCP